ncbi:hypothetical protein AC790_05265 [Pantoea sp. RIT-PI-b]|nr:hypothetical protein AC790_05265 [Pantoea sp. RIT-PI-b]
MREEFHFFQPQDHNSCIKWLRLRRFVILPALCCTSQFSHLINHKNETLFYKLEISRHFLCDFATTF